MIESPNHAQSQYDVAIEAICNMDISSLQKLFAGQEVFDDVPVKTVLCKLKESFDNLKQNSDKKLTPIPGYCVGCKKGMCGFRFIAPNAKKELTLIFKLKDTQIIDLCNCGSFHTAVVYDSELEEVSFDFYEDEKFGFIKTETYLQLMVDCNEALSEFDFETKQIIKSEIVSKWIKTYQKVYLRTMDYRKCSVISTFRSFYYLANQISMYFEFKPAIDEALSSFNEAWVLLEDEFQSEPMEWLSNVSDIILEIDDFDHFFDQSATSIALSNLFPNIHIAMNVFTPVYYFKNRFTDFYWSNFDKRESYSEKKNKEEGL